ncbi:3-hydroxyacyl-CoA dehydrogenase family protein [Azotobacter beijerinckii]|uniref:L-gulonate 3-dehydrogenase n=1 Tax=Azotobacter beijerinckii TaxID=170623 RepID=A0A1I4AXL1_9GAMM|nr:3-hydroxyacyl-CoA dehydrogenase family protein [Azotobacter beijerinckii]SFB04049.1 3-hydroxybutyryl-CoA dehydrogenase [Azotobacter beijerinckii]SFK61298.1 3-hydroxybutyryl-CoA dehydrogenase [Azotobacter beijerinckii]
MTASPLVILGAGLMGIGIATHFARHGHRVLLRDPSAERLAEVPVVAGSILAELADAGRFDRAQTEATLARLATTARLEEVAGARLLIEAIPERLDLKRALYAELERFVDAEAIIASNTSGLPPDDLAEGMRHPERLLIAHFWNPPHLIPLVEIVPGSATRAGHLEGVRALLAGMELEAVVLDKAIPGFVGNRLQFAILREALHIVQSGAASAETVDRVMRASLGRRYAMVGPLEAADMGGLDTFLDISRHLMPTLAKDESVLAMLEETVGRGRTGLRSGEGFYRWDDVRRERILQRRAHQLRHALKP